MNKDNLPKNLTRLEFAAAIVKQLGKHDISCVLVGGACVSIYTNEKYVSDDLDFISPYSHQLIGNSLKEIGFEKDGRYFVHKNSQYYVEFPSGPVAIGERVPVKPEKIMKVNGVEIKMLSPTQSVMDRLAAWYHWHDRNSLLQALEIVRHNDVDLKEVEKWSDEEGEKHSYQKFIDQISNWRGT